MRNNGTAISGEIDLERGRCGRVLDDDGAAHARRARTGLGSPARWTARYTVERATENSSARSALVCVPACQSSTRCASWAGLSLGCLPRSRPLGLGDLHALPRPHPDQVRLEFSDHPEDVVQQPPDRVGRVVHRAADVQLDPGLGEFLDDVAGVGQGPGEPVELRDDQGVAGPARCEGLAQPGPCPVGAGQTVVDIDPIRLHAERDQRVALRGEVLRIGAAPAISDEHSGHRITVAVRLPSPGFIAGGSYGNQHLRRWKGSRASTCGYDCVPLGVPWVLAVVATPVE